MTNVTTPEATPQDIEALQAAITSAQEKVTTLKAAMANDAADIMAEAMKSGSYSTLNARTSEIASAERQVEIATSKLDEASRMSRWENLAPARKPIEDAIHEMIVTSKPQVAVTSIKGVAKVEDDGSVKVSLTPTLAKLDMSDIEAAIAATFDGAAFKATNVTSIEINVIGLDTASPVARLLPTANVSLQFRNKANADGGTAPRASALMWEYNGSSLTSKQFLEAFEASGHEYAAKRAKTFDNALRGKGDGLSTLARDCGKVLGIEPTEAPATA